MNIGVLASGRGSNLQALLDAGPEALGGARVVLVLSDQPGAPALERARKAGVAARALQPADAATVEEYEQRLVRLLAEAGVELVVLAGYMRVLGPVFLEAFGGRTINIHPSLLPAFPGLRAQKQALEYGVKISGCTVHYVDDGVDTGPVIAQKAVPVKDDDDEQTLSCRILQEEHRLLPWVVSLLARGLIRRQGRRTTLERKDL